MVPLIADLAAHIPRAPLVAVLQAGDPRPLHDPRQQAHHVLGREITAGEHHHIQLTPAHQPRHNAAGDQHRADIGDQRGQVQPGKYLPRRVLERRLTGEQIFVGCGRHDESSPARRTCQRPVPLPPGPAGVRELRMADYVGVTMIGMAGAWVLRPFGGAADHALVEALWSAALEPRWPLLPRAIAIMRDGFVAVDRGRAVGCVAVDLAGSIPLVMVAPADQRRGIGTDLLSAALARLSTAGVSVAHAGSGGPDYIWPGVPLDLPAAGRFFAAGGWQADRDTVDLVADLRDYRRPAAASERARRAGVTIAPAVAADLAAVVAFETATFPSWTRWFRVGNQDILLARDGAGTGRGIGTALVARASQILRDRGAGACHIGWTGPRVFLHPGGIPAVAALPDVSQGHELSPGAAFHPSGQEPARPLAARGADLRGRGHPRGPLILAMAAAIWHKNKTGARSPGRPMTADIVKNHSSR